VPRFQTGLLGALALSGMLLTLIGCGPADVNQLRRNYSAELNSWFKQETPASAEAMITVHDEGGGTGEKAGAADGTGEPATGEQGGEGEMPTETPETVHVSQKVTLDIMVSHNGAGTLPGITLDIYQADAHGNDKRNWKLWVDTSDLGVGKQITQTLEGVDLAPDDTFAVEVRQHVPPKDQDEYREFPTQSES
jgi:hypothetical protein